MRRGNNQRAIAHLISRRTKHLQVLLRISRNAAVVLLVLRVSEDNDALDLGTHCGRKFGDCACNHGTALTMKYVSGCYSERVRLVEEGQDVVMMIVLGEGG